VFIELLPDEEEKAMLENNIQVAIGNQMIDLDDAIDLREVRNVKLANQLLKIKRKKKLERDQQMAQQNMQAQAQANAQQQQAAAQMEAQKQQQLVAVEAELESTKNQLKIEYLQREAQVKKELMQLEFDLNMQLKGAENQTKSRIEASREDRKDARMQKQAENQERLVDKRKGGESVKRFESSGNDIVTGDSSIGRFDI
jgi:RNase P/RNase MRP subunit p29